MNEAYAVGPTSGRIPAAQGTFDVAGTESSSPYAVARRAAHLARTAIAAPSSDRHRRRRGLSRSLYGWVGKLAGLSHQSPGPFESSQRIPPTLAALHGRI